MEINFYFLIIIAWLIFIIARTMLKANVCNAKGKPNTPLVTSPLNIGSGIALEEITASDEQTGKGVQKHEECPADLPGKIIIKEAIFSREEMYVGNACAEPAYQQGTTGGKDRYIAEGEGSKQTRAGEVDNEGWLVNVDLVQAFVFFGILRRSYV